VGAISVLAFWPSQYAIKWMIDYYFHGLALHAFGPADVIFAEFKFSLIVGLIVGLPMLFYQTWMFVVPAIHPKTRSMVYSFIFPSFLLALAGLAFAHFVVIPRVVAALLAVTSAIADPTFGVDQTLGFVLILLALFAVIFQTPIILIGLARLGIVNGALLGKYRRHAFFAMVVVGGIAAPDGNPLTMAMLAIPMYVLYEVSIWIILLSEKSWSK
jgi:sec-independent protein translocase protein TatC